MKRCKKELERAKKRIAELDRIFKRICENDITGAISRERNHSLLIPASKARTILTALPPLSASIWVSRS